LDSCYIDVPVPFKRGDLVEADRGFGDMGNVYVLKDTCKEYPRHNKLIYRGDLMDMTANVYYERNGAVNCDCMHFYPDLRYCRRELEGGTRMLKYLSLYLQDKLCLCGLLNVQKYLLADGIMAGMEKNTDLKYQLDVLGDGLLKREETHDVT